MYCPNLRSTAPRVFPAVKITLALLRRGCRHEGRQKGERELREHTGVPTSPCASDEHSRRGTDQQRAGGAHRAGQERLRRRCQPGCDRVQRTTGGGLRFHRGVGRRARHVPRHRPGHLDGDRHTVPAPCSAQRTVRAAGSWREGDRALLRGPPWRRDRDHESQGRMGPK